MYTQPPQQTLSMILSSDAIQLPGFRALPSCVYRPVMHEGRMFELALETLLNARLNNSFAPV
jgi:hypothetical protein